jgi:hypothetical protein
MIKKFLHAFLEFNKETFFYLAFVFLVLVIIETNFTFFIRYYFNLQILLYVVLFLGIINLMYKQNYFQE